jgi:hypothetical protein
VIRLFRRELPVAVKIGRDIPFVGMENDTAATVWTADAAPLERRPRIRVPPSHR